MAEPAAALPPELLRNLNDPAWRLENLYWIVSKGDDQEDDEGLVIRFKPNAAQRKLLRRLHHRNVVLKVRQRGITTLIAILWLDTALFAKDPIRCGIIAHERDAAEDIFRSKVLFAYGRLDPRIQAMFPVVKKSATELQFANGASIRVATSMRSGTTHRLHISELGKIAAKYPAKAREVITGSIPSVPKSGITVVESTAEGQDGVFFDLTQLAMTTADAGRPLTVRDYRFFFFPWWDADEYEIDPVGVHLTETDLRYFNELEARLGFALSAPKRAWYVATLRNDFAGEQPLMWQEYPSFPEEAFKVSIEGAYYATQLATMRKAGRIRPGIPVEPGVPVNTFWDIGRNDMTAIWLHQRVGLEDRFIGYYENSGEEFDHYVGHLQKRGVVFGTHWLPHDADIKRQGETPDLNRSPKEMLENLWPGQRFEVVSKISARLTGIQQTRSAMASAWIDEVACAEGIVRLTAYRKQWNKARGCWSDEHVHDDNSNGADAFRQWGQLKAAGETFASRGGSVRSSKPSRRGPGRPVGRSSMSV